MGSESETSRHLHNIIRLGVIAEVDLVKAGCRVQTGEILSDFVPWLTPRTGNTIEWSAPSIGEQVILLSPGGDLSDAVALRGLYSDAFAAPAGADTQHVIRYPDGALVRYDHAAHALTAILPASGTAEITAQGGITLNGPLTVNGTAEINGDTTINGDAGVSQTLTAQTDVIGGGKSLKGHKHTAVQGGSGVSGPPQ